MLCLRCVFEGWPALMMDVRSELFLHSGCTTVLDDMLHRAVFFKHTGPLTTGPWAWLSLWSSRPPIHHGHPIYHFRLHNTNIQFSTEQRQHWKYIIYFSPFISSSSCGQIHFFFILLMYKLTQLNDFLSTSLRCCHHAGSWIICLFYFFL